MLMKWLMATLEIMFMYSYTDAAEAENSVSITCTSVCV